MRIARILLSGAVLVNGCLYAEDWPQWLGPNRDSIWRETGIVQSFPTGGPPIAWRAPLGSGYSGPSVSSGRVYVMDRRLAADEKPPTDAFTPAPSTGAERVLCFNESDGKLIWEHSYPCKYTVSYPAGPRTTPLVHDGKVYTLGAEGNLHCLNSTNGAVLWAVELKKYLSIKAPMWGFSAHPLLDGDKLICMAGGDGSTAIAFNKDTGKEAWRALSTGDPGYASPVLFESANTRQILIWHSESINSLNPQTGQVYWSVPFQSRMGLSVGTPRKLGDLLFFTSFYDGSIMLRLDPAKPQASPLWQSPKGTTERNTTHINAIICTPFLENNLVFGVCSYGQLRCLKAETGERLWETLQPTTGGEPVRWANAFLVKNGDRFFLFNEKGDLIIARLDGSGYQEISRAKLLEPINRDPGRPVVWSHPAFANRRVYARNDKELICADLAERR